MRAKLSDTFPIMWEPSFGLSLRLQFDHRRLSAGGLNWLSLSAGFECAGRIPLTKGPCRPGKSVDKGFADAAYIIISSGLTSTFCGSPRHFAGLHCDRADLLCDFADLQR